MATQNTRIRPVVAAFSAAVAGVALTAAFSWPAAAVGAAKAPAGIPDVSKMALTAADLPRGARVLVEGYRPPDTSVAAYERMFTFSGKAQRRSGLAFLDGDVALEDSADTASLEVATTRAVLRDPGTRRGLARLFADAAGVRARRVRVGKPSTIRVGDDAVAVPITILTRKSKLAGMFSFMAVDRVVAQANALAVRHRRSLQRRTRGLLAATAAHIRTGLSPVSTSPPTITGTAAVGAVLHAGAGAWSEATQPKSFTYQWQRCDATGAACVAIAGATATAYTIAAADKGSTLRIAVTASNDVGATTAVSSQTGVIP